MATTITVRKMTPPDLTGIVEADTLGDAEAGSQVAYQGGIWRACLGPLAEDGSRGPTEWTRVVTDGYEIVGSGGPWGTNLQVWPGYESLDGKHSALAEARQLAVKFDADLVIVPGEVDQ